MENRKVIGNATLGDIVSFDVYPSNILGTNFKGVKILAELDADTVSYFNTNPMALHAEVYPYLPQGTINDAKSYTWLKLELPIRKDETTPKIVCIGTPWIKKETIEVHEGTDCQFTILNVSLSAPDHIRSILQQAGYELGPVKLIKQ